MPEDAPGNPGALPGWAGEDSPGEPGDDALALTGRVRGMQAKLHRWAGEDPSRRFGDLFNLVCDPDFLADAWDRVRGNKGARTPGADGVTVARVTAGEGGAGAFLDEIRGQLKAGTYRPSEVRQVMIPKRNGKLRKLGIPTLADRVVQAALKLVLEPIFEADFQPCSYGFRPNRRAQDAIAEIQLLATQQYTWAMEADIRACFDEIDHTALMDRIRGRIKDKRVLALVKAFLKAGVVEDGILAPTREGTPQGALCSATHKAPYAQCWVMRSADRCGW
jgi:RNA-directed DNA polymerase